MCDDCEQKFSKLENSFANSVFYSFHNDKVRKFDYDENLKSFIISMGWRGLQIIKEGYLKKEAGSHLNSFVIQADKEWREFLNGESESIDQYETHLLFLDYLKPDSTTDVDPKFHWYLLHATDFTICTSDKRVYFYVKLPWMAFVISIEPKKMDGWDGTIVNKNGHITTGQTIADGGFVGFLQDRAKLALYSSKGPSKEVATKRMVKSIKKDPEKYLKSNIYESWIVERNNIRRKKMENMPDSLIELVDVGILDGKGGPGTTFLDNQAHKMKTRRIADMIAGLSEEDAKRLHELVFTVNRLSQILKENKHLAFTSDSLHITYIVSFDTSNETRFENVKREYEKLREQTQEKIHFAVFSFSPIINNYQSLYFVPLGEDSKIQEKSGE